MLKKNCILRNGIIVNDAYHVIKQISVGEGITSFTVVVWKEQKNINRILKVIKRESYDIKGQDNNNYFLTPHTTDNVIKRAEQYLLDKVTDYSGAIVV